MHKTCYCRNETESHEDHSTEEIKLTHFSTFALSGTDGSIRWHHLPGEFEEAKKFEVNCKRTTPTTYVILVCYCHYSHLKIVLSACFQILICS